MKQSVIKVFCVVIALTGQSVLADSRLSETQHLTGKKEGEQLGEGAISISKDSQLMVAGIPSYKNKDNKLVGGLRFYKKNTSGNWDVIGDIESPFEQSKLGYSVAIDPLGKNGVYTVVSGAYGTKSEKYVSGAGAVLVYTVDFSTSIADWKADVVKLFASAPDRDDWFGYSVDIYGDTIVVGSPNDDSSEQTNLNNPVYPPPTDNKKDEHAYNDSGAVYVFNRLDGIWTATAYLKASDNTEIKTKYSKYTYDGEFGTAVAINERQIFVGAPAVRHFTSSGDNDKSVYTGALYAFEKVGNNWKFNRKIKRQLNGYKPLYFTRFAQGITTSKDYTVISVSSPYSTSYGKYAYVINNKDFSYYNPIMGNRNEAQDHFGTGIAIDGNHIVIGASKEKGALTGISSSEDSQANQEKYEGNDLGKYVGTAYLFALEKGEWVQKFYFKGREVADGHKFGFSVDMNRKDIIVGAPGGISSIGDIYVFTLEETVPVTPSAKLILKDSFENK